MSLTFFRSNGHKLEELVLCGNYGSKQQILKLCPNVKKVPEFDILFNEEKEYLPKLEHIFTSFEISFRNVNEVKILSDKYSKTLKILNISLNDFRMTIEEVNKSIEYISPFENLKELTLELKLSATIGPIDDCLSLIGQKCNKLLKLDLKIRVYSERLRFLTSFSEFNSLKKLTIDLPPFTRLSGSVEYFKHCKQLIELDINGPKLREDFFANIASFVPKLQSLRILTDKLYSDSFINSFHLMKNIQKIEFRVYNNAPIILTKYWYNIIIYFGKSLIEVMLSPNGKHVIRVNDNCGLIHYNV